MDKRISESKSTDLDVKETGYPGLFEIHDQECETNPVGYFSLFGDQAKFYPKAGHVYHLETVEAVIKLIKQKHDYWSKTVGEINLNDQTE